MCSQMDEGEKMQDVFMNRQMEEHAPFVKRRTSQAYQQTIKEQCVNIASSEPLTIEDSIHFSMPR